MDQKQSSNAQQFINQDELAVSQEYEDYAYLDNTPQEQQEFQNKKSLSLCVQTQIEQPKKRKNAQLLCYFILLFVLFWIFGFMLTEYLKVKHQAQNFSKVQSDAKTLLKQMSDYEF